MLRVVLIVGVLPFLLMLVSALLLRAMLPPKSYNYLVLQLFPNRAERLQRRLAPSDYTWFEKWGQVIGSAVPAIAMLLAWGVVHNWRMVMSSLPLLLGIATYWLIGGLEVVCNLTIGIGFCAFFLSDNGTVKLAGLALLAVGGLGRFVQNARPTRP